MPEPRLLLTGFGPFPGVPKNPTARIAKEFDGEAIHGLRVVGADLEVCFESIASQLQSLFDQHEPVAILLLGVAVERDCIGLEGQAYNLREAGRPDAKGRHFDTPQPLLSTRSLGEALQTSIQRQDLLADLEKAGLPVELSEDPGRYLCNASFFHALHFPKSTLQKPPSLFVHLPQVGNPIQKNSEKTWTMKDLREATRVLLKGIAAQISPQTVSSSPS